MVFQLRYLRENVLTNMPPFSGFPQLRSMNPAETLVLRPPVYRALKKPFTKRERRSASPATQGTSCWARPPSTASLDTHHCGIALHLHVEVNTQIHSQALTCSKSTRKCYEETIYFEIFCSLCSPKKQHAQCHVPVFRAANFC